MSCHTTPRSHLTHCLLLLAAVSCASCTKTSFLGSGKKTSAPKNPEAPTTEEKRTLSPQELDALKAKAPLSPTAPGGPAITEFPEERSEIKLELLQLKSDALFKNCMFISVDGIDAAPLEICNKGTNTPGQVFTLPVLKNRCNTIHITAWTWKPIAGGGYNAGPDYKNTTADATRKYFVVLDATKPNQIEQNGFKNLIHLSAVLSTSLQAPTAAAIASAATGQKTLRVYYEDQPYPQLDSYIDSGAWNTWESKGIDFNDFILDIRGQGVNFTINGSNIYTGTEKPEGTTLPPC